MHPRKTIPRLVAGIDGDNLQITLSVACWPAGPVTPKELGLELRPRHDEPDGAWEVDLLRLPLAETDPATIQQARRQMRRAQGTILAAIGVNYTAADKHTQAVIARLNQGLTPSQELVRSIESRQNEEVYASWGFPVATDWWR